MNTHLVVGESFSTDGWPFGRRPKGCTIIDFWGRGAGEWKWHHSAPVGWYRESVATTGSGHAAHLAYFGQNEPTDSGWLDEEGRLYGEPFYYDGSRPHWVVMWDGQVNLVGSIQELTDEMIRGADTPEEL